MSEEANENLKTFKDDLLGRKSIAINLTNIIKYKKDLRVLAIDSSWGTGKTTFLNMWMNMLENDEEIKYKHNYNFEVMYFNAWENDYIQEPLGSLLDEFNEKIKCKDGKTKTFFENQKERLMPYFKIVGQIATKHITRDVLDLSDLTDNEKKSFQELSDKIGKGVFEKVSDLKNARSDLKKALEEFQGKVKKNVIVFIDELDRCRPTYAIELLENIKHIFNIENYTFVIALDKEQLSHSIKTLYGQGMDSDEYLRRFFDLEYSLPQASVKDYIKLKNKKIIDNYKDIDYFCRFIEEIFTLEEYSLRAIDKAYNYIELILPNLKAFRNEFESIIGKIVISYIYAYFIDLNIKHKHILKKIKSLDGIYDNKKEMKKNFIPFNYLIFNCKDFKNATQAQVNKCIDGTIEKYIELFYFIQGSLPDTFKLSGAGLEDYTIKVEGRHFDLYKEYHNIEIISKMDFLEDMKIE